MKAQFFPYIQNLQDQITQKLESLDHLGRFKEENWERPEGGGGRTRVLEGGLFLKKEESTSQLYMASFRKACKTISR